MTEKSDFSALLKSIGVHSTLQSVQKSLEQFQAERRKSNLSSLKTHADDVEAPKPAAPDESALLELKSNIDALEIQIGQLDYLLSAYQMQNDRALPSMIRALDGISDYRMAYSATTTYDVPWFANLLMSLDAKVKFATALYAAIKVFCNDNTDTIRMISEQDAVMLEQIMLPTNLSQFR